MNRIALALLACVLSSPVVAAPAPQKDDPKCKDHPLFTRMPESWIRSCDHKQFDAHKFPIAPGKTTVVEGEVWSLTYYPQAQAAARPSALQIFRNYENAIETLGGAQVGKDVGGGGGSETFKLVQDGKEIWVQVWAEFTSKYALTILERKAMQQDVIGNAAAFADGLQRSGHVAVGGIFFDTGLSVLKPESQAALAEIAKLLEAQPALAVHVVGHTDNVGAFDANLKLSQARAEAVVQALVTTHHVAAARLHAWGDGPTAPVSSNEAEEGRARNRRVELVRQ